ncbi:DnaB-like helicase C-terminal domain-containing protein [Embleya sp. NPDC001921]
MWNGRFSRLSSRRRGREVDRSSAPGARYPDKPNAVLSCTPGRPRADIATRLTAAAAGVDHRRLRAGTLTDLERHAADAASARLAAGGLLLDDGADLTLDLLRETAADIAGLRLVAVDPLNDLLPGAAGLAGRDVRHGVAALRRLAADLDVPVVAVWETSAGEPHEVGAALAEADTVVHLTREGEQAFAIVAERDLGNHRPGGPARRPRPRPLHRPPTGLDRLERDRLGRAGRRGAARHRRAPRPRSSRTSRGPTGPTRSRPTGDLTPHNDHARPRDHPHRVHRVEAGAQGCGGHRRGPAARCDRRRGRRGTRRRRGRHHRRERGLGPPGDPGRDGAPGPVPGRVPLRAPGTRPCPTCCASAARSSRTRSGRPAPSGATGTCPRAITRSSRWT